MLDGAIRLGDLFKTCKQYGMESVALTDHGNMYGMVDFYKKAKDAGLSDRLQFDVASASSFPGSGYDLIAVFDSLHDMGDPVGVAKHIKQALAADGTWLIVEPLAGDTVEQNLNPVGRAYYAFSTFLCVPNSLSQEVGLALGAQAGEKKIRDVVTAAGFTRFRRINETPFNVVYEVRP